MRVIGMTLVLAMFWQVILPVTALAQSDSDRELTARFDSILESTFSPDQPGAAAIVVRDGVTIYKNAIGVADLELDVPLNPYTIFRIGSITKQFTAAAIMMLVEEDKVSLDDEITKFLPDYPTQGATITVAHLLNHTSGIRSYTNMPGWMEEKIVENLELEELIDGFKNEPMEFQPGERFKYNNSGYVLLGAIIEKASGMSYEDFIEKRIFEPLNMTRSSYDDHQDIVRGRASGYDGTRKAPENAKQFSASQPYAAGSLLSTVDDLATWNAALFGGKVVSKESLEQMITRGKLNNGTEINYGYGLVVGTLRGQKMIFHGGGIFGFVTQAAWLPDDNVFVAVLCNATFSNPLEVANKLGAVAIGNPYPEFKAVDVNEETLGVYTGVYQIDEKNRFYVFLDGNQLKTRRTGGGILAALPHSENEFHFEKSKTHFKVVTQEGKVSGIELFPNGGRKPTFAKRTEEQLTPRGVITKIDFDLYDDYVGEFEIPPATGVEISITRDGNRLIVHPPEGDEPTEIFPVSENVFCPDGVDVELTFVRGQDGSIDELQLIMNNNMIKAKRKKE